MSTLSGGSVDTAGGGTARYRMKTSRRLIVASATCLVGWILVLVAFAAPYWLSSYQHTYSTFVRLGLWDFCFNNYRHPPYQYDQKFNGCHWIYSEKYQNIRDWLQPGWFIFVQGMMVIALIFSICSLMCLSLVLMYYFVRYQVVTIATAFVFQTAAAVPLLLAIIVFGVMAFDRGWLLNPSFNYLDWAYYVVIAALCFHVLSALLLFFETLKARERRQKMNNLVYNMQPRTPTPNGSYEGRPMMPRNPLQPAQQRPYFTEV